MSIYKGERIQITVYGESHAPSIGATVKGLEGFKLYETEIEDLLSRRKAVNAVFSTSRIEPDRPIYQGVKDGVIQDVFGVEIINRNVKTSDYNELYARPRPSHADYAEYLKNGTLDFSGGGRFSGRMTAPLCVVGGECKGILAQKCIQTAAYIASVGGVNGKGYRNSAMTYDQIVAARAGEFPSLDNKKAMLEHIAEYASRGDSVGGKVECVVYGLPSGIGDNLFEGVESKLSSLLYAIPAVKGVEFGYGFDLALMSGSQANDQLGINEDKVTVKTNRSGGINGGITNGEPLTIGVAFKPTPSISLPQTTVDLTTNTECEISIKGRHDPCIAARAVPVVEAVISIGLFDLGICSD